MKRSEIQEQHKWDLSDLFVSDQEWEKTFAQIEEKVGEFVKKYKGKLTQDAQSLYSALKDKEEGERLLMNVLTYSRLKLDENTKDSVYQSMVGRAEKLVTEVTRQMAFFVPEILQAEESHIHKLLEHPSLELYKKYFDDLFRRKPHTQSEEIEGILAQVRQLGSAPSNAYGMLLNADMVFDPAVDSKGEEHPLTNGSYVTLLMSKDRELRKDAFDKYYRVYKGHINTIASLMQSEVNKNIFFSKAKNHPSAREAALFENKVPSSVPDQLIEAVNNNLSVFHKYMALRKKVMGLDELHLYDVYLPIIENVDYEISYDEAKDMVIDSLAVLGDDYQSVVKKSFEERWIDVYETEGKRGGAYSWGTYDSRPYILLNHKDDMNSMFTLTHEMGHSMHSYLTRKNQPYVYGNYSIFVAEVASTTNEALLNDHLLKTVTDEGKRKYILNHYLEQFRGTIFRQTMFAEFERDIHKHVEEGGSITADFLCDHYLELNKKYFGPDVVIDDAIRYEWARIPHMYYNFYVYQYATGFSAAISLSKQILEEGQPALERYLEFLSSGSKDYPINILRKAGADMETKTPVSDALSVFEKAVDELEKLLG